MSPGEGFLATEKKHQGENFLRVVNWSILAPAPARSAWGQLLAPGAFLLGLRTPLTFPDQRGSSSKRKLSLQGGGGCMLESLSLLLPLVSDNDTFRLWWNPFSVKLQTRLLFPSKHGENWEGTFLTAFSGTRSPTKNKAFRNWDVEEVFWIVDKTELL